MKNKIVFVACDTSNIKVVKKIINKTKTNELNIIPKFGLEFFYSKNGRVFLENLKKDFFLDLKINDISNTAKASINSIKDLKGCKYLTVHASGGLNMIKAVKENARKINKKIQILVVTVLTSLDNKALKEIGYTKSVKKLVLKQASLAKETGCGLICSAEESKIVKKKYKNMFIVTPGIRLPGDQKDDQSRIVTPYEALKKLRADAIVIGRSLTKNKIENNVKRLIDHLSE